MLDLGRGRDTSAMERARRMVARDPENQEGVAYLAELAVVARAPNAETLVKPLAEASPDTRPNFLYETFRTLYAWTLAERGERARANSMWDAALAQDRKDLADGNEMFDRSLEIAAISAVRGDPSNALEWLEHAYQRGFKDPRVLARDPFSTAFGRIRSFSGLRHACRKTSRRCARAVAAHDTLSRRRCGSARSWARCEGRAASKAEAKEK